MLDESGAEAILRRNIEQLMKTRHMKQAELAERVGKSQGWLSKRLNGKLSKDGGSRFQVQDLDAIAAAFELSPAALLRPGHQNWDRRRSVRDRRSGFDRRNNTWVGTTPPPAHTDPES